MSFFSCFACGGSSSNQTSAPVPVTPQKVIPQPQLETSKLNLTQQFSDIKSHSNTTMTFMTTDSFPTSTQDEESYIRKKIQQIRKKDLPERKAMESEFIKQNLTKSQLVYLVEKQWSQLYTAFLKNIEVKQLRSINNSRLFDNKNVLRTDIREKDDYFIINERVWKFVQQMYGGGPGIVQDMFFPVISLSNRKLEIPPVGIFNPLYLCYMISVLQCMISNQHIAHYFYKKMFDDSKKKMVCHMLLHRIAKNMMETRQGKIDIKDIAALFESRFNPSEQHDAHEFLIHLGNMLQQEAKGQFTVKPTEAKNPETAYSNYFKNNRSVVDRVFVGQCQTLVECSRCSVKSTTYDAFMDIQVDLQETTLEGCLKRRFQGQKIQEYECDKCKKKNRAFKKEAVTKTPNYLILTLKKFTNSGRKIEERIKYSNELNIKNLCKGHCGETRYLLQSVLVHKGSRSTKGHYYCYTRRAKKSWFYISDDLVKEIEPQEVFGRDAYMLFYERMK